MSTICTNPGRRVVPVRSRPGCTPGARNEASVSCTLRAGWTGPTTITASSLNVGDSAMNNVSAGQVNQFVMGSGVTTLNVNTINIGMTYQPEPIDTIKDLKPGQPHYGVKRQNLFPDPEPRGYLKLGTDRAGGYLSVGAHEAGDGLTPVVAADELLGVLAVAVRDDSPRPVRARELVAERADLGVEELLLVLVDDAGDPQVHEAARNLLSGPALEHLTRGAAAHGLADLEALAVGLHFRPDRACP